MSTTDSESEIETKNLIRVDDISEHSDPSVSTDQLPDDSPIFLFEEAQQFFRGRQPPFVLLKRSQVARRCVIPTVDGTRPNVPTMVDVVPRLWDKGRMFWTIDVNHKRYIVKAFPGEKGEGGAKWLSWAGPGESFNQKPLALSEFSSTHPPPKPAAATDTWGDDSDSSEDEVALSELSKRQCRVTETTSLSVRTRRDRDAPFPANDLSGSSASSSMSGNALRPIVNNAGANRTAMANALTNGRRPTPHSELPRRIPLQSPESHEGPRKRRRTDISARELMRLASFNSPPVPRPDVRSSGSLPSTLRTQSSSVAIHPPPSISTGLFTNLFDLQQPAQNSAQKSLQQASQQSANSHLPAGSAILDQNKQDRTKLIVHVAPSAEYQPLKLSSCMTSTDFYKNILGIFNLTESAIEKITVTFTWMQENDLERKLIMNRNLEACFAHLIEEIEDSPVWDGEKGKCVLDVEIVKKEKSRS